MYNNIVRLSRQSKRVWTWAEFLTCLALRAVQARAVHAVVRGANPVLAVLTHAAEMHWRQLTRNVVTRRAQ